MNYLLPLTEHSITPINNTGVDPAILSDGIADTLASMTAPERDIHSRPQMKQSREELLRFFAATYGTLSDWPRLAKYSIEIQTTGNQTEIASDTVPLIDTGWWAWFIASRSYRAAPLPR